ncbi:MAG: septum formation protein [Rhodothermales bacterium]|jgi:septum formation protein
MTIEPSFAPEVIVQGVEPAGQVEQLARDKATDVAKRHPEALVLGADTVVVLDGRILGKPNDEDHARSMLRTLSGRSHVVYTGIALVHSASGRVHSRHACTQVTFAALSDSEIRRYVEGGSPMDKAGAYGIQDDAGSLFIERIDGDYYNVVGLPLRTLYVSLVTEFADLLEG